MPKEFHRLIIWWMTMPSHFWWVLRTKTWQLIPKSFCKANAMTLELFSRQDFDDRDAIGPGAVFIQRI